MGVFDLKAGNQSLKESGEILWAYVAVSGGIFLHWIWEIAVGAVTTGTWKFGSLGIIIARLLIALIAGAVSFVGIYKQLETADPKIRLFVALTQGFAVDALASPIARQGE